MDLALFMERYGYSVLLDAMVVFTFGFLGGTVLFWAHLATSLILPVVLGYVGAELLIRRLYSLLFGEAPPIGEDSQAVAALPTERTKNFGKYL